MLDGGEYLKSNITKKKKSKNKRRFSDEQIRSLEVMFETETKLEPKKKLQLAKELGLQPRQVAIWFQNKRARWKSKHIEKEYSILLANYNNLAAQCDSLKKEKHSLLTQLQKLKNEILVGKSDEKENERRIQETGAGNSSTDGESDYPACKMDFEVKNIIASNMLVSDDEDSISISISSIKAELLGLDEENHDQLLKMAAAAGGSSLASVEDWGSLDSDIDIINQQPSDESFQWWDFWS